MKKHLKYGIIYGNLISLKNLTVDEILDIELSGNYLANVDKYDFIDKLNSFNLNKIYTTDDLFDVLYVSVKNMTKKELKRFFEFIIKIRPHEFNKTSKNHYRIWWD